MHSNRLGAVRGFSSRRARLLASVAFLLPTAAHATDFTVTNAGDTGAAGQYRTQVNAANANPGADRIIFSVSPTIASDLTISDSLTIGTGAAATVSGTGVHLFNGVGSLTGSIGQNTTLTSSGGFGANVRAGIGINGGAWTLGIDGTVAPAAGACPGPGISCGNLGIGVTSAGSTVTVRATGVVDAGSASSGTGILSYNPANTFGSGGSPTNVNVLGGTVKASNTSSDGITLLNGGTITMTGGLVSAGLSGIVLSGGDLGVNGGTLNMTGGTVAASSAFGTALQVRGNTTTTIGAGATVTGNTGISSGGIAFVMDGPLKVVPGFIGDANSIRVAGTVTGTGGTAMSLFSGRDTLTLEPTFVINGLVDATLPNAVNTLQLGGTGNGTFDVSKIGAAAQFRGFTAFNKIEGSAWQLTGTTTDAQPWSVQQGSLTVNGSMANSTVNMAGGNLTVNGLLQGVTATAPGSTVTVNASGVVDGGPSDPAHNRFNTTAILASPASGVGGPLDVNIFGGTVQSGQGEAVALPAGGTLLMTGGLLKGGVPGAGGGAVFIDFGTMSMTGGSVVSSGFGILARESTVTIGAGATVTSANDAVVSGTELYHRHNAVVTGFDTNSQLRLTVGGTLTPSNGVAISLLDHDILTVLPTAVINGTIGTYLNDPVLGRSNSLIFSGTGNGTFDLSKIGPGFNSFTKTGDSNFTMTGTATYGGPVVINGGTLSVNGNLASASSMTVNAGGTLGGNGTVGNTTISGGTLAPGNSIGTITVNGNLVFNGASTYAVEVSPTDADRTNVTGTANLAGTVTATFQPGSYIQKTYTILSAAARGGTFGSLVTNSLPSGFTSSLSYDATSAFLNLALIVTPPVTPVTPAAPGFVTTNINQFDVATGLVHSFNTTGGIPAVFGSLTPAQLTQASGELATGTQQATFRAMDLFLGLLTDPFVAGRGDAAGAAAGAPGFAEDDDGVSAFARAGEGREAFARMPLKAPAAPPTLQQRWSVWAAGFGGQQNTNGNAVTGSNDATASIYGLAVGADTRLSPNTLVGFAMAGGGTNFHLSNGLGSGSSDLFQAGAFARHTVGSAYVSAALAYGWQDVTTKRTVTIAGIDQLRGRFDANTLSGRVEVGNRFVTPWAGVTPYAAGQAIAYWLPGYAETVFSGANTFALTYAGKDVTTSRSELGLRTDKSYAMQNAILTLRGRAAWAHNFDTDRDITGAFQILPASAFVVFGAAQAHDAALTTASAEMKWSNSWSGAATFEGEFSGVTQSYAGKGVVRYQW